MIDGLSIKARAWLTVLSIVFGTGCGVTVTTIAGGCKVWVAIVSGLGAGLGALTVALRDSPQTQSDKAESKP